jgi:hypothetical protein
LSIGGLRDPNGGTTFSESAISCEHFLTRAYTFAGQWRPTVEVIPLGAFTGIHVSTFP